MVGSAQGPKSRIYHLTSLNTGQRYVTCGEKHVNLWDCSSKTPKATTVKFHKIKEVSKNSKFLCTTNAASNGYIVCTDKGHVVLCHDNVASSFGYHNDEGEGRPVNAVCSSDGGDVICTGGYDGSVVMWFVEGTNLFKIGTIKVTPEVSGVV